MGGERKKLDKNRYENDEKQLKSGKKCVESGKMG